jgi:cell fate (sporulation/competence/biofilm development) regulator YlbF (YheA/YmcA/DUF963 family)
MFKKGDKIKRIKEGTIQSRYVDLIDEVESFSFALEEYKDLVKEAEDNLKTAQEGLDKFRADNKNKENLTNKKQRKFNF